MENLEIEYKVMITEEGYQKILHYLKDKACTKVDQINYYYDTKDGQLKKNHLSLRIRHLLQTNQYILTLKEKKEEGQLEHEFYLLERNIDLLPEEIEKILATIFVQKKDLLCLASLRTIRQEYVGEKGLLCIDHSIYGPMEDFEIEYEASCKKDAQEEVEKLLSVVGIKGEKSHLSKQARAKKHNPSL